MKFGSGINLNIFSETLTKTAGYQTNVQSLCMLKMTRPHEGGLLFMTMLCHEGKASLFVECLSYIHSKYFTELKQKIENIKRHDIRTKQDIKTSKEFKKFSIKSLFTKAKNCTSFHLLLKRRLLCDVRYAQDISAEDGEPVNMRSVTLFTWFSIYIFMKDHSASITTPTRTTIKFYFCTSPIITKTKLIYLSNFNYYICCTLTTSSLLQNQYIDARLNFTLIS